MEQRLLGDGEWVWTQHALKRATERFPDMDLNVELAGARAAGKKTKKRIRQMCQRNAAKYMGPSRFAGRYYLRSRHGVGFVIHAPNVVITVLDLRNRNCEDKEEDHEQ